MFQDYRPYTSHSDDCKEAKKTIMKDPSQMLESYSKESFWLQIPFDEVPSATPGLKTPRMLDLGRRTWKERSEDTLSGVIDDVFAPKLPEAFVEPAFSDEVLFTRVTITSPQPERSEGGERNKGHINAVRNDEVTTVSKAEALVLCKQLPEHGTLLPSERACKRMPQEIWNIVIEYLPSLTGKYAAQVFGFKLEERHQKHADLWDTMFCEEDTWTPIAIRQGLNPFLVGDDLQTLYNDPTKPAYICLLTGDKTGEIRHDKMKLLKSLREHHFNENGEVVFHNSKIILNIAEALYNPFFVTSTPEKLFSCRNNHLRSASLYLTDNQYALRTVGPNDIVGIGEWASGLKDVSHICGITLTHPEEMALRQRHQQCFRHPRCPPTYPVLSLEYKYNGDNILGWEWENEP